MKALVCLTHEGFFVIIGYNRKDNMTDQTRWGIDLVQQENKARNYDKQNSIKLQKARDIYKESKGLDYISEHMKKQFDEIMLGGRQ